MFYTIVLQRKSEHKNIKKPNVNKIEDSTLGVLSIYEHQDEISQGHEILNFFTCENIGPSTDTPKQDKRIMPREYQIEWTNSSKNNSLAKTYPRYKTTEAENIPYSAKNAPYKHLPNVALWVTCDKELPSFRDRRILIHVGNYPQDTEGCILIGKSKGNGTVHNSIEACKDFFDFVKKVGIENIRGLVVREI